MSKNKHLDKFDALVAELNLKSEAEKLDREAAIGRAVMDACRIAIENGTCVADTTLYMYGLPLSIRLGSLQ